MNYQNAKFYREEKVIVFNNYLAFFKAIQTMMMALDKRTDNHRKNIYC